MTTSDEFEADQALLDAARRGLSPSPADAERVLNATRNAIASAATAGVYATVTGSSSAPSATSFRATTRSPSWKLALSALSIAALSGAIGYYFGLQAAPQASRLAARESVSDSKSVSASASAPAPASAPANVLAHVPPSVPLPTTPRVSKHLTPLPTEPPPDQALPFSTQEEITAMRRIELALREHEPQRALTLLFELDRNVPEGKLMQERQAAFAMARCAAGLGSAPQLVAEFAAHYRNSAYLARVRQTCAAQPVSAMPATPAAPAAPP